jgi:amidase
MSATELAEAIRSRQVSSQEVIEAHLRRIEAVNPSVNAVTIMLGEQALEAAKAADHAVGGGGDLPPFHGVERLKAAGAIPIGHTNLATFAVRWHRASELHGALDMLNTPDIGRGGRGHRK